MLGRFAVWASRPIVEGVGGRQHEPAPTQGRSMVAGRMRVAGTLYNSGTGRDDGARPFVLIQRRCSLFVQYVNTAMTGAEYDRLPYGMIGYIPEFEGLFVLEETKSRCEEELVNALEIWLMTSFHKGLEIPVIDGLDLAAFWRENGAPPESMRGGAAPAS